MLCPRVYLMNLRFIKNNTPKVWKWRPEGVKGAIGKPPCRARRREIPCARRKSIMYCDTINLPHCQMTVYIPDLVADPAVRRPTIVIAPITRPSRPIFSIKSLVSMDSFADLGFSFITSLLWGSTPRAIAGRLSVRRLINSKCTGAKGTGSPAAR